MNLDHPANRGVIAYLRRKADTPSGPPNIEASMLDLADLGVDWVFGDWRAAELAWCRTVFEQAGADSA